MTKVIFLFIIASFLGIIFVTFSGCGDGGGTIGNNFSTPTEVTQGTPTPTDNPTTPTPSPTGVTTPVSTVTPGTTPTTGSPTPVPTNTQIPAGKSIIQIKALDGNNQPISGKYFEIAELTSDFINLVEDLSDGIDNLHTWIINYVNVKSFNPTDLNGITSLETDSGKTYVVYESQKADGKILFNEIPFENLITENQKISTVVFDKSYKEILIGLSEEYPTTNLSNQYYNIQLQVNGKKFPLDFSDQYSSKKYQKTIKTNATGAQIYPYVFLKNGNSISPVTPIGSTSFSTLYATWKAGDLDGIPIYFNHADMSFPDGSFSQKTTLSAIEYKVVTSTGSDQLCITKDFSVSQTGEYDFISNLCYNGPHTGTAICNVEIIGKNGNCWSYKQLSGDSKQITNYPENSGFHVFPIINKVYLETGETYYAKITVFAGVSGIGISTMSTQKIATTAWTKVDNLIFEKLNIDILNRAKKTSKIFLP